jgi:energy-coupling factor transporter transmembrane protein EcfT
MIGQFFIPKRSIVHKLDFWAKFLSFLLILPLSAFLAPTKLLLLLLLVFIILLAFSRISVKKFWQMTKIYHIPIILGIIVLSLFFSSGIIGERLVSGVILGVRFVLLISFGVLFAMVTNPIEIPGGFLRARLPHKYGITLMVGYRMMPLISDKISTIIDAQKARGAEIKLSFKKLPKLATLAVSLLVPILHSTLETSVRLSDTLISRGYNPDGKITVPPTKLGFGDFLLFGGALLILFLAFVV